MRTAVEEVRVEDQDAERRATIAVAPDVSPARRRPDAATRPTSELATHRRGGARRRRSTRAVLALAFTVALLGGVLAACTPSVPQAVLQVPGSVRVDYFGANSGTVLMCVDRESAVTIDASWPDLPGGVPVLYTLRWNGVTTLSSTNLFVTPVLQPGCGTLTVGNAPCGTSCFPLPNYAVVTADFT